MKNIDPYAPHEVPPRRIGAVNGSAMLLGIFGIFGFSLLCAWLVGRNCPEASDSAGRYAVSATFADEPLYSAAPADGMAYYELVPIYMMP